MDPAATWEALLRSFRQDDEVACRTCCRELLVWLAADGAPPVITGVAGLDHVMVQAVCTAYLNTCR